MHLKALLRSLIVIFWGLSFSLNAQNDAQTDSSKTANPYGRKYPPRIYDTRMLKGKPPVIDGRLNDACWADGGWHGQFRQQIPTEGAGPSAETEFKILYDEKNIYFAFRAYDDPGKMHRYFGRRDDMIGDVVGVCFDSYADKRTGFEFDLTAGGGKTDLILMNGGNDCTFDSNWDAVWYGKTGLEDSAWTAEFQIPLSQLRYGPQDEQVWGMHAWRWIDRLQEEDQWNLVPRINTGRMYNIGELHGIRGLKRFRHIELLPHALGRVTADPRETGNPYATGSASLASAGLDAKIGLTSDFTLDATINPDFGQVEADPSVMNLTAFETFYEEKRPFFLEGKNILEFNLGGDMLFYSRRIGHAPTFSPGLREGEYIRSPENTGILSALKVTGKSRSGLSLGVVQSVTAREEARISFQGMERNQAVEPLSNYFVGRVQKDWDKGNTSLGGAVTSTRRRIADPVLDFMARDAVTGGFDFVHYFNNRSYALDARAQFSRVSGKPEAMLALQRNPVHNYQRPGADHLGVDSSASSLSGHGGKLSFGRVGHSRWRYSDVVTWFSPGLDLNDIGYLQQADQVQNVVSVGYTETEPAGAFREYGVNFNQYLYWDFGGLRTYATTHTDLFGQFTNRWGFSAAANVVHESVETRLLRGGPAVKTSPLLCASVYAHTDQSRKVAFETTVHRHWFADGGSDLLEWYPEIDFRISNAVSLSGEFQWTRNVNDLQYVSTKETAGGPRYLLARIRQKTIGATFRLNVHLTPDLSIQYYGSPFISTGKYSDFRKVTDPRAGAYENRFHRFEPEEIAFRTETNDFEVREPDARVQAYSFGNPDFSFRQFRSNLVVRWEYKPGSALYVVWAQQRTGFENAWENSVRSNADALWNAPAHNVFLAKMSYWFSI
jgi:hypothetical protein